MAVCVEVCLFTNGLTAVIRRRWRHYEDLCSGNVQVVVLFIHDYTRDLFTVLCLLCSSHSHNKLRIWLILRTS